MNPIERVRAVVEAGTSVPWEVGEAVHDQGREYRYVYLGGQDGEDGEDVIGWQTPDNARKLALAVNLALFFVALWEANVALDACERLSWDDYKATQHHIAVLQRREALAALNEAATREVGAA